MTKDCIILLLSILFTSLCPTPAHSRRQFCNNTCGKQSVPYPFGFSADCPISLTYTEDDTLLLDGYPLEPNSISQSGALKIHLEKNCSRPLNVLPTLYQPNYAPTGRNALLLHGCPYNHPCRLPSIEVETWFNATQCSSNQSISCYWNTTIQTLYDYETVLESSQCKYLLSSINFEKSDAGLLIDSEVMELQWWLPGRQCRCSDNSDCIDVTTPDGFGFRCRCKDGMIGDGYAAGEGCREDCDFGKYVSGKCGGRKRIAIFAGGIGGVLVPVVTFVIACTTWKRYRGKAASYTRNKIEKASGFGLPVYPYKFIEKATNGFSADNRLGIGAYGTVYLGKLGSGSWAAVKKIKYRNPDTIDQFVNEIGLISSVNHPNLVRLLGCCIEHGEQILVYEFMPNGTLSQHLHGERGKGLPWGIRASIAAETAAAIAHLHSAMDPPIYHRDIKTSNILLDENYRSKLADFGLSRLGMAEMSHVSTAPQGTLGYLDPQYHQNFVLSDKSDVYSFGVVLVEIISGLRAVDFSRAPAEVNLAALAAERIGRGRLAEIIDPFIGQHGDSWTFSSVHKVAEVAFRCLSYDSKSRPSMMEVAAELELIRRNEFDYTETSFGTPSLSFSSSNANDDGTKRMFEMPVLSSHSCSSSSSNSVNGASPVNSPATSSLLHNCVR